MCRRIEMRLASLLLFPFVGLCDIKPSMGYAGGGGSYLERPVLFSCTRSSSSKGIRRVSTQRCVWLSFLLFPFVEGCCTRPGVKYFPSSAWLP